MVLLASNYDQSRFLKAQDLTAEKKFRIKSVTEKKSVLEKTNRKSWSYGSHQPIAALFLIKQTSAHLPGLLAIPAIAGSAKSSSCSRQWRSSAVK
jgi:hypothetical protein